MYSVLSLGSTFITDESSLYDFIDLEDFTLPDLQKTIQSFYSVDVSDMKNGNLLEIFKRIQGQEKRAAK